MKTLVALIAAAFVMTVSAPAYAKFCYDKNGKVTSCSPEGKGDEKGPRDRKKDCET